MKGILFTELLDFVERHAGSVTLEKIIQQSNLASGGAYTTVGNYSHEEALRIVSAAADELGSAPAYLMRQFGRELFPQLAANHPQFFRGSLGARSFLNGIQTHIHDEVAKLYPDSTPPHFDVGEQGESLVLLYRSHRPLAMIALGLLEGCIDHFGEPLTVKWDSELSASDTSARFLIGPK